MVLWVYWVLGFRWWARMPDLPLPRWWARQAVLM